MVEEVATITPLVEREAELPEQMGLTMHSTQPQLSLAAVQRQQLQVARTTKPEFRVERLVEVVQEIILTAQAVVVAGTAVVVAGTTRVVVVDPVMWVVLQQPL